MLVKMYDAKPHCLKSGAILRRFHIHSNLRRNNNEWEGLDDADGIATPGGCAGAGGAGGVAGVALVVLLALALWVWDSWRGSKPSSPMGTARRVELEGRQTGPGLCGERNRARPGQAGNQVPLTQRLADAQLRPSFQKADQLIRAFVNQDPAARARVEKDNSSRGLALYTHCWLAAVRPTQPWCSAC
jgi:hypothetical protein